MPTTGTTHIERFVRRGRKRDRTRNDRGATLVEASLVMPIMILIMLGTLELGLAFKDYLTVSFAAREGSRMGALAGDDSKADCEIVKTVVDSLDADLSKFQGLQIYAADPATGDRILAKTNTWKLVGSDPHDCDNDWTVSELWPATARNTEFGPSKPLDIIGVRIIYAHDWVTGLPPFTGTLGIDEQAITRIEPESFE